MNPIVIKKNPTLEIRVQPTTFKDRKLVDIREYFQNDQGEWLPMKKGIALAPELVDPLIEALKAVKGAAVTSVLQVGDDESVIKFAIVSNPDALLTVKKHLYQTIDEAKAKTPPDGYAIYRVHVKGGAFIKAEPSFPLFNRQDNDWKQSEEHQRMLVAAKRPAGKNQAAKRPPGAPPAKQPPKTGNGTRQAPPSAKSAAAKRPAGNIRQTTMANGRPQRRPVHA